MKKEQNGIGDALALPHALLWVLGSGEERVGHSLTHLPSFGQTRKWNSQKESTRTGLSPISCLPPFSPFSTREEGDLLKSPQIGPTCLKKYSSALAPKNRVDLVVALSWGRRKELPRAGRLTTEMYSLTVLEARSPSSRCRQSRSPSGGPRGDPFLAPSSFWWPRVFLGLRMHHSIL